MTIKEAFETISLHDTTITEILTGPKLIDLHIEYIPEPCSDQKVQATKRMRMCFELVGLIENCLESSIKIIKIGKITANQTSIPKFIKILKKHTMNVYLDYYSSVAQSILIIGTINGQEYCVEITDIESIQISNEQ